MTISHGRRRRPRTTQRQAWRSREGPDGEPSERRLGTLVGHYGVAVDVRFDDGQTRSVRVKRRSGHAVGDRVAVAGEGLQRLERSTELRRRDAMGRTHVVAANLDVLGIVVASRPSSPTGFVDRALISARAAGIAPFLLLNKCDLPEAEELAAALRETFIDGPGGVELPLFRVSAKQHLGLAALFEFFANAEGTPRRGAFVGTSGVGKSSLLNAMLPELSLEVAAINEYSGLGRHTTTTATLHRLPAGGELIDTPGFRDFGLVDIELEQLRRAFPGFAELLAEASCRFGDCRHDAEPDCAIKAAVADGRLSATRWQRYKQLLAELEQA